MKTALLSIGADHSFDVELSQDEGTPCMYGRMRLFGIDFGVYAIPCASSEMTQGMTSETDDMLNDLYMTFGGEGPLQTIKIDGAEHVVALIPGGR